MRKFVWVVALLSVALTSLFAGGFESAAHHDGFIAGVEGGTFEDPSLLG